MKQNNCPECGYPLNGIENRCPECGYPIENERPNTQSSPRPCYINGTEYDFNEKESYTPFKKYSWFFKSPWPLHKFPMGRMKRDYPFWGVVIRTVAHN